MWATQSFTPLRVRMLLARTLVLPTLIYGCEIYSHCDSVSKRKLNVAFNSLVRYIYGLRRYDSVSNFSKNLLNMTFENFLKYRALNLLSKILLNREPQYLSDMITRSSSQRTRMLTHPRYASLTSERQFFIYTIRLWNSLPRNIREIDDVLKLQTRIKLHFSQR